LSIRRGCARGFCTLEATTEVAFKVDDYYAPEWEKGQAWDDPTLAINWPVSPEEAVLSERDQTHGHFADFVSPFRYDAC